METINERLKRLRKECHKIQDEFAEIFGMTRSGICDIEKGRNNVTDDLIAQAKVRVIERIGFNSIGLYWYCYSRMVSTYQRLYKCGASV